MLLGGSVASAHDPIPVPIAVSASTLEHAVIVTSFGPLLREGASARYLCETDDVADVSRYLIGPDERVVALADRWFATWDAAACRWHRTDSGRLPIVDAQHEPETGNLLVLTSDPQSSWAGERTALQRSAHPYRELRLLSRFADVAGYSVLGDPAGRTLYIGGSAAQHAPVILRSRDGGANFDALSPVSDLKVGIYRIVYVDREQPERILVRASGVEGDFLMRSDDGGSTLSRIGEVQGRVLRAVRLADGMLVLLAEDEREQRLYVGGFERPFHAQPVPERLRDLVASGDQLVGLAEMTTHGLVLLTSSDRGASFSTHHDLVRDATIERCLEPRAECVASCRYMVDLGWLASTACPEAREAQGPPPTMAVGPARDSARPGERVDRAPSAAGCATSAPGSFASAAWFWLVALVTARRCGARACPCAARSAPQRTRARALHARREA